MRFASRSRGRASYRPVAGRSTKRDSTSTTASSMTCSRTRSSRSRRSSTGILRRCSRMRAAGPRARRRRPSSSTRTQSWGEHAPGRTNETDAVAAAHHLLLSHGWAVEAIRRASPDAQVGITLNLSHAYPASDAPEDEAAAWQVDGEGNRWFLDAIFKGAYPADVLERNEVVAPFVG